MHRLGSPYSRCTDGVEGLDVPLLYKASYTMQVHSSEGLWEAGGDRERRAALWGETGVGGRAGKTRGRDGCPWDPSSRPLLSPQACLVSCFQQLMVETCSCGYYFLPLPAGAEYCSSARHPAWGEPPPFLSTCAVPLAGGRVQSRV